MKFVVSVFVVFCVATSLAASGYTCADGTFCMNGGTCTTQTDSGVSYHSCTCTTGWRGAYCNYRETADCNGNLVPDVFRGDGICHDGQYLYNSGAVNLNCAQLNYDNGDCANPATSTHAACAVTPNPCGPGKCYGNDTAYYCSCPRNAVGAQCQFTPTDPCTANPCKNGAKCIPDLRFANNRRCVCGVGTLEPDCDTLPSVSFDCSAAPCVHGKCDGITAFPHCDCTAADGFSEPYYGPTCANENTACSSSPCQNGGVCYPYTSGSAPSYLCGCPSGFGGSRCQYAKVACASNPCQNGATCKDQSDGTYSCTCASGYSGPNCDTAIAACFPNPCQHGGTCVCANGFSTSRCANGDVGFSTGPYACVCAAGYFRGTLTQSRNNNCTHSTTTDGFDCTSSFNAFPIGWRSDGACQHHWSFHTSSSAIGRYQMVRDGRPGSGSGGSIASFDGVTCKSSSYGDPDCTSEVDTPSSAHLIKGSVALIVALLLLL